MSDKCKECNNSSMENCLMGCPHFIYIKNSEEKQKQEKDLITKKKKSKKE